MNYDNGWIKLHRKLLDSPLWKQATANQKVVMVTIMLMVNHSENKWIFNGVEFACQPGEIITSWKSICANAGKDIKRQSVRSALKLLENHNFLTIHSTNQYSHISICNWDTYQSQNSKDNLPPNQCPTNGQPTGNQRATTNKECKNIRREEVTPLTPLAGGNEFDTDEKKLKSVLDCWYENTGISSDQVPPREIKMWTKAINRHGWLWCRNAIRRHETIHVSKVIKLAEEHDENDPFRRTAQ